jgi:hypothetical protein
MTVAYLSHLQLLLQILEHMEPIYIAAYSAPIYVAAYSALLGTFQLINDAVSSQCLHGHAITMSLRHSCEGLPPYETAARVERLGLTRA